MRKKQDQNFLSDFLLDFLLDSLQDYLQDFNYIFNIQHSIYYIHYSSFNILLYLLFALMILTDWLTHSHTPNLEMLSHIKKGPYCKGTDFAHTQICYL